jgi:hypothetical protein
VRGFQNFQKNQGNFKKCAKLSTDFAPDNNKNIYIKQASTKGILYQPARAPKILLK